MLRAKQKKAEEEAKAKAAQEAAAQQASSSDAAVPMDVASTGTNGAASTSGGGAEAKSGGEQVRLLGIGGQSVRATATKGKRRQPAELRIQKGECESDVDLPWPVGKP